MRTPAEVVTTKGNGYDLRPVLVMEFDARVSYDSAFASPAPCPSPPPLLPALMVSSPPHALVYRSGGLQGQPSGRARALLTLVLGALGGGAGGGAGSMQNLKPS